MILKKGTKYFFIFLFIFFISSFVNGQIKIGLNSGVNIASYTLSDKDPEVTLENKTGFSIGGIFEFPFTQRLSARIVPMYIQRGGKARVPSMGDNPSEIYYNYIALAPYLTYCLIDAEISVKFIGGLSFGYLVLAKAEFNGDEFDLIDMRNRFNLTSDFGLEIDIPILEKMSLIFNGIYSIGLKDISNVEGEVKTRGIQINTGFLYNI